MSRPIVELDFDVVREPWNRYELEEGPILKAKVILKNVSRKTEADGKVGYGIDIQHVTAISHVPIELQGPPTERGYSPEELQASIVKDDVRYSTLREEWNEYVAEDGCKIRIKNTVVSVAKTDKCDKKGNPIYLIKNGVLPEIRPPKKS